MATLGADDFGLLLGLADEQHAFVGLKPREVLLCDVVLALATAKLKDIDALALGEAFDLPDERSTHRRHQCTGGELVATMGAPEPGSTAGVLQYRHVVS